MAILFAALMATVTLSGVAFANDIHDGTRGAIMASSHQTEASAVVVANTGGSTQIIIASQPAIATIFPQVKNVTIASNLTGFQAVAPKDVAANAISEVTYEPKFPNLALLTQSDFGMVKSAAG